MVPLDLSFLPNALWESAVAWILSTSAIIAGIGAGSGSMTIAAVAGYSLFAFYAIHTDISIVSNVFIATLVLFTIGFAFKVWRLEGTEG